MRSPEFVERSRLFEKPGVAACGAFSPEGHRCTLGENGHSEHEMHVPLREWRFVGKDDAVALGLPTGLVTTDRFSGPQHTVVARWPAAMQRRSDRRRVHRLRSQ